MEYYISKYTVSQTLSCDQHGSLLGPGTLRSLDISAIPKGQFLNIPVFVASIVNSISVDKIVICIYQGHEHYGEKILLLKNSECKFGRFPIMIYFPSKVSNSWGSSI